MSGRFGCCSRHHAIATALLVVVATASLVSSARAAESDVDGRLVATTLWVVTDAFVVDVYHNGSPIGDQQRKIVKDVYGACVEKVDVKVQPGDWLVFNVVTNRLRAQTKGARYFAVAGVGTEGGITFVSESTSGRWTSEDNPDRVGEFLRDPAAGMDAKALAIEKPWPAGDGLMRERVKWTGEPVWGTSPNTWIKYVAADPATTATRPTTTAPAARRQVVYIGDATGTMIGLRFKLLRERLALAIRELGPDDRLNVVFFRGGDSDAEWAQAMSNALVPATRQNKQRALEFLGRVEVVGKGTNPLPALRMAMRQRPTDIWFLTDGEFNNHVTYEQLLAELRKLNTTKRVRIHTVAFMSEDARAEEVLEEIATEHGGTYQKVTDKDAKQR